jgi:SSS family solute:Na+ symporter
MAGLDYAVIVVYLIATIGVGLWLARGQRSSSDYFLGERNLPAWSVLLSIVGTETSALTVISVPGVGARGDLTFLQLAFGYCIGRLAVAVWLLPGYFRGQQETAYQRLETRFGPGTRRLVSATFLVTRFLGDGVRLFAGAIPLAVVTGWSAPTAIVVMGLVTLVYAWMGGLKAVIWTEVVQLGVYIAGGMIALWLAWSLAGGPANALAVAAEAGKLRVLNFTFNLTDTYTFIGGLIGGGMLSAASHGADQLIVQRLLSTRSLRDARIAIVGSGVVVVFQFLLFLLVGSAIWAAGLAPEGMAPDQIFPNFIVTQMPVGVRGLVIAGILAAAMSTSINALASSVTYDFYAGATGRTDPIHLLRVGKTVTLVWGFGLIGAALAFVAATGQLNTPIVVLALSIASITYGALLGSYILAGKWPRANGRDVVIATLVTVAVMLFVVFAGPISRAGYLPWLEPLGRLAWPWYVPLGTALAFSVGVASSLTHPGESA